ncbi:MAG: transglycosylase domain-containing protein [Marinilabiliales bacterium]
MKEKDIKKRNKGVYTPYIIILWSIYSVIIISIIVLFTLIATGKVGYIPSWDELENPKSYLATEIYSSDNVLLGTYFAENRSNVTYDQLSPYLINGLIATEDERYFKHSGIDLRGLIRAFVFMGKQGGGSTITQQLSKLFFTKTAKSKWERLNQKLNEWIIAVMLEKRYTKEEIITMYFNKFDFLNLAVGIKSASYVYFNTTPDSLKIEQAAMLVGMAKNPAFYNPLKYEERTKERRNIVLVQMKKHNYINQQEYDSLSQLPLGVNYQKIDHKVGIATYFREYLRLVLTAEETDSNRYIDKQKYYEDLDEWKNNPLYGWCNKNKKPDGTSYNIYKDGLKIYTTINSKMQKYAEDAVKEHLPGLQEIFFKEHRNRWEKDKAPFYGLSNKQIEHLMELSMKRTERYRVLKKKGLSLDSIKAIFNTPIPMKVFSWKGEIDTVLSPMDSMRYYKFFLRAGFMSVEPQTGYVRAYVGGIDYKHFMFDQVNMGRRQVGSTFKPFVYTLAIQEGYSPCYKVPNVITTFEMPAGQKPWTPNDNSDKKLKGKMITLKTGMALSLNPIAAWVMKQFSPEAVIKVARSMGIKSEIPKVPSICLGVADLKLSELVGAYTTFANKGIHTEPIYVTRIEDHNGNILGVFSAKKNEALSEKTAYIMLTMLQAVTQQGTAIGLRYPPYSFKGEIGGKTGTTQNHSDGWFMGVTPNLVSGAWVGCEDRAAHFYGIYYGQGARMALPIWGNYMKKVYADSTLGYSENDKFERPSVVIDIDLNCKSDNDDLSEEESFDIIEEYIRDSVPNN